MSKLTEAISVLWHGRGPSSPHWTPPPKRKTIQFASIADLSDALNRAKTAHGEYERGLGQVDTNWPLWYAGFMAMEQGLLGGQGEFPHTSCQVSSVRGQTSAPCVETKLESSHVNLASEEEEYWDAHR